LEWKDVLRPKEKRFYLNSVTEKKPKQGPSQRKTRDTP